MVSELEGIGIIARMRILHLVHRYYPAVGGAETHMQKLSEHLVAQGHDVTVATSDALDFTLLWRGDGRRITESSQILNGVEIRYFPTRHLPLPRLMYPIWRRLLRFLGHLPGGADMALRLCHYTPYLPDLYNWLATTSIQFDLVAAMGITFEPLFVSGQALARRQKIPFAAYPLTHFGAGERLGSDPLGRFYTMPHQNRLVCQADALLAQTATEARYYEEHGLPAERIFIAGPGVEPDEVAGGDGRRWRAEKQIGSDLPIILTMSSLTYDKGTPHIIEAVRQLWAAGMAVELAIAGNPQPDFQAYFDQLPRSVQNRLHMLGHITDQEKRDVYDAAELFVMPSRTDSFGIVYLEAWLAGLAVIGAKTWGVMDDVIRDGENGALVEYGDTEGLAGRIQALLADKPERRRLAKNGRAFALGEHTWAHKQAITAQVYLAMVEQVGGATAPPSRL